jgi:hypothetical protein
MGCAEGTTANQQRQLLQKRMFLRIWCMLIMNVHFRISFKSIAELVVTEKQLAP